MTPFSLTAPEVTNWTQLSLRAERAAKKLQEMLVAAARGGDGLDDHASVG